MDNINKRLNNMNQYESPTIMVLEVLVEKGFASSSSDIEGGLGGSEGMGGGGDINVGW